MLDIQRHMISRFPRWCQSLAAIILLMLPLVTGAQPSFGGASAAPKVVKVTATLEPAGVSPRVGETVTVRFDVRIDAGYHLFSAEEPKNNGYRPTVLELEESARGVELVGTLTEEGKLVKKFDDIMEDDLKYYQGRVVFRQRVKVKSADAKLVLLFSYQFCTDDEGKCFYLTDEFPITVKVLTGQASPSKEGDAQSASASTDQGLPPPDTLEPSVPEVQTDEPALQKAYRSGPAGTIPKQEEELWWLFFRALGAGVLALFTPCVFPMIPLTVSFFTKRSGSRSRGLRHALFYSASIVVIFVGLGLLLSVVTGQSNMAYTLATSAWVNLFFFVLLVAFGLSFLGLFEISLPSSWSNSVDAKSSQGGLLGIFFMALTLVLVSFSCTAPLVGTLLFDAVQGSYLGPTIGMLGFSLAFAVPFGLFALFPGMLSRLPKSGGWLNVIKVVLGFLELAFAFKFLSNADLVWHAGILDREVYISGWIVLFALLGLYLAGRYRLPHDTPLEKVGWGRLFLALLSFWFVLYLVPGLWGAPLESLGGFLPNPKPGQLGVITVDSAATSPSQFLIGGLFDREIVLAMLISAFFALGLFFMKKLPVLKFPHESVGVPRLMAALFSFWLVTYLFSGLWGAPLPLLSAILPPTNASMGVRLLHNGDKNNVADCELPERKLQERLSAETPIGFCAFYDLEEGLAYAKKVGKPVLLDFTGHTCANCRLMEQNVWRKPEVKKIIASEYVLVSLFVDEAQKLPKTIVDPATGRKIRTVGEQFLQLQQTRYGTSAQPYYALLSPDGKDLVQAVGYTPDITEYREFLQDGLNSLRKGTMKE
jgi:thiol:disulfide interchange protein